MNAQKIFSFLFSFNGRMPRKPFWIAYAINRVVCYSLATLLMINIFNDEPLFYGENIQHPMTGMIILIVIPIVIALFNGLSLASRRFHDTGRSFSRFFGLYLFACVCRFLGATIIPLCIAVLIIVLLCLPTDFEDETYGPAPKRDGISEESTISEEEQPHLEEYDCTHLNGILLEPAEEDDQILFEEPNPDESLN